MKVLAIPHIFRNYIRKIMGLFEEYKNHPDKAVRERANNWGAAIGLQNVDGLSVSEFLIQLARQQIEGEITMEEVPKDSMSITSIENFIVLLMRLFLLTQRCSKE